MGAAAGLSARWQCGLHRLAAGAVWARGGLEVAERMRTAVAQATWLAQPAIITIGVATLQSGEDASSLYARADAALYAARAAGRNRVELALAEGGA